MTSQVDPAHPRSIELNESVLQATGVLAAMGNSVATVRTYYDAVVSPSIARLWWLTFWSRKSAGSTIAAQNGCLATISELALAARAPEKTYHHCVLLGHSFGGLVLENTISHSILDASSTGSRNTSPWDMAVAFNPADSSIGNRQLMSELDYLYKYDPKRHAYIGGDPGAEAGSV